jgi:hypothetical protein
MRHSQGLSKARVRLKKSSALLIPTLLGKKIVLTPLTLADAPFDAPLVQQYAGGLTL